MPNDLMVKNTKIFCVDCSKINTDSASCSECCYKGTSWLLLLLNEFIFKVEWKLPKHTPYSMSYPLQRILDLKCRTAGNSRHPWGYSEIPDNTDISYLERTISDIILALALSFVSFSCSWVRRQGDRIAHELARLSSCYQE